MRKMIHPTVGVPMMGKDLFHRYLQYKYAYCLERAGASVFILPWDSSPKAMEVILNQCIGFLFPGGQDIQPELYGQTSGHRGRMNPERDAFEMQLLREVLAARRPLFCIGRGMQLLNVAFGGTLLQDMKLQQEYEHNDFSHRTYATHPVEIDGDSLLWQLLKTDTITVNSLHHQAADIVGEGLWITADSPEGFPEALQIEDYPFCLALQWHPEYMVMHTPSQQKLFKGFVDACHLT